MNTLGAVGGPIGNQQMMNTGTPGNAPTGNTMDSNRVKLHTYIYDYFLKNEYFDLARLLHERVDIEPSPQQKQSPNRKQVNGDSMDADNKDDALSNKPADLPLPNVPNASDSSFLFDWWCQFWDCFHAQRGRGTAQTKQYLAHVQQQARLANERQRMMVNPQMQNNMNFPMGGRQPTPQQLQQFQQIRMQQQMMAQNQMQREGSGMDMNGQQRPQTPGSGDNAPSPKRQRLEGQGFAGQMGPMGRGQPQGMQGQQFNNMQMQNAGMQAKSMQAYAQNMRQQMQNAIEADGGKGMPNQAGLPQGSPAMDGNGEFYNAGQMRGMPGAGPAGANNNSNHALQDYQMQLMLLEQQNKKRLLMARQEQDSGSNPGNGMPGAPAGGFAPNMSPSQSRTGPSPTPDEQMKRGTPKMAPGGMPQQNPDGSMPQGMYPQMVNMGGKMVPNPQGQPATSHPAFNPQMANGQRPPNGGPWPQGPPQQMMPGGPQQPPNMTPQQRNAAMPPPPAPATGESTRTQPSSPSQSAQAPPTPSQSNKPNPKNKKDTKPNNKKAPAKKGATGATPAADSEQPPTPTPAPPITPTAPAQGFNSKGPQGPGQNAQNVMQGQNAGGDMNMNAPFGALDSADPFNIPLEFSSLEGENVLDNFDFDSFLNNDGGDGAFSFDANMAFGTDGGLEAGGDV